MNDKGDDLEGLAERKVIVRTIPVVCPSLDFKEMEEKISSFRNPEKYISQRIENEIRETDQKYKLFVR